MSRQRLNDQDIHAALQELDGWTVDDGRLHRAFEFSDFVAAFGFMTRVALLAQAMDHHPDWTNVYNRVSIHLHTHDSGGITGRDTELARLIDGEASS
ncbi:MAG TPA: 4a-hydroxytetrahydrobiopterin dehydratase [Longimicrobiales bacterium]|nr:4a-hydroxytetrahydrobiopterin dehydratase [Longimicrobiales bacterium]